MPHVLTRKLLHVCRHSTLSACEKGAVAVIVALLAPVLIGAMGLGSEAGYWYLTQREVQNAADFASHGAARRLAAGDKQAAIREMAEYLVAQAEIDPSSSTIVVNNPPLAGPYAGDDTAVEVIVTETVPRMFTAIYTMDPVPIEGRAVAKGVGRIVGCVLALSRTAEPALKMSGNSSLHLDGCDAISNGPGNSIDIQGSPTITAECVHAAGSVKTGGAAALDLGCDKARENARPFADPLSALPEPALVGACQSGSVGKNNQTTIITPIASHPSGMKSVRYCNGLDLSGDIILAPGLYLIEGGNLTISANATITGVGVTIFLGEGARVRSGGGSDWNITAPKTGPYAGIAFFASRKSVGISHEFHAGTDMKVDGTFYAPTSNLSLSGGMDSLPNGCTLLIAATLTMSGNGDYQLECPKSVGPKIERPGEIAVVE